MLLHPEFLWGLAGAAVPLLIHLLARRRARRVPFPSLRLLHAAERKRRTLARLRQPLTLLLRILALGLVALALATPVVGPVPKWVPLPANQSVAVIVDDTLSMATPVNGESSWDRATEFLDGFLRALTPWDEVAMLRLSSPEGCTWMPPAQGRRLVTSYAPTAFGATIGRALVCARDALARAQAPNRAVLIVTDLQASAWQDLPCALLDPRGTRLLLRDVGDERATNLAVTDVEAGAPKHVVGRRIRIQATACALPAEKGAIKDQTVVMQLRLRDRTLAACEQHLGEKAPAVGTFTFQAEQAKDDVACIGLVGGPFGPALDDLRYHTLRVRPPVLTIIASASNAGRYVATALNPFHDPVRSGFNVHLVSPNRLETEAKTPRADLVVLADCPPLSESATEALSKGLAAGRGVLVLLGDEADVEYLSTRLIPKAADDRSLVFGPLRRAPASSPLVLTEIDVVQGPLNVFANPRAGNLGTLRFHKIREMKVGPKARVLARFGNGIPAIVEWRVGSGRLVLFNTSGDGSWGDHIRSAAYVPLIHNLALYLAGVGRPYVPDVLVGERPAIMGTPSLPVRVKLRSPTGEERVVAVEGGLLPEVNAPGEYRVSWPGFELAFAANIDPRESDLARIDEKSIREALKPWEVTMLPPDAAGEQVGGSLPRRADLCLPLLLLALAVLLTESVVSIVRRGPSSRLGRSGEVPI